MWKKKKNNLPTKLAFINKYITNKSRISSPTTKVIKTIVQSMYYKNPEVVKFLLRTFYFYSSTLERYMSIKAPK